MRPGVWCAGSLGWDANQTFHYCRTRATEWLPDLKRGASYPCYAVRRLASAHAAGTGHVAPSHPGVVGGEVFFDVSLPLIRSIEIRSAYAAALVAALAFAGHVYVRHRIRTRPRRLSESTADMAEKAALAQRRVSKSVSSELV